jgi:cell division protein FtsW (lipid II flippase)
MKVAVTTLAFCVAALLALGLVMIYSASLALVNPHAHRSRRASAPDATRLVRARFRRVRGDGDTRLRAAQKTRVAGFHRRAGSGCLCFHPAFRNKTQRRAPLDQIARRDFPAVRTRQIALIIMLAWYCDRSQRKMDTFKRGVVFPGMIIAAALGLIFIEPDRGTTILLAAVSGMMLLVAGVRPKHLLLPALGGAAILVFPFCTTRCA